MSKKPKKHEKNSSSAHVGAGVSRRKRGLVLSLNRMLALLFIIAFGGFGSYRLIASYADTVNHLPTGSVVASCSNGTYTVTGTFADSDAKSTDATQGFLISSEYGDASLQTSASYKAARLKYAAAPTAAPTKGQVVWTGTGYSAWPAGHAIHLWVQDVGPGTDKYLDKDSTTRPTGAGCPVAASTAKPPVVTNPPVTSPPKSASNSTLVTGRVYNATTSKGVVGAIVYTCLASPTSVKTDASGNWSVSVPTGTAFCAQVQYTLPTGWTGPVTANNSEHSKEVSYQYQVAGVNDYHNTAAGKTSQQYTWDRAVDTGYDFKYTSAKVTCSATTAPKVSNGQRCSDGSIKCNTGSTLKGSTCVVIICNIIVKNGVQCNNNAIKCNDGYVLSDAKTCLKQTCTKVASGKTIVANKCTVGTKTTVTCLISGYIVKGDTCVKKSAPIGGGTITQPGGTGSTGSNLPAVPLTLVSNRFKVGDSITSNTTMFSEDKSYKTVLELNGNLVVRNSKTNGVVWNPNLNGKSGVKLSLNDKGNLQLLTKAGKVVWSTGNHKNAAFVETTDFGHIDIMDKNRNILWTTATDTKNTNLQNFKVVAYSGYNDGCGGNATHYAADKKTHVSQKNYGPNSVCKCENNKVTDYGKPIPDSKNNPGCSANNRSSGGSSGSQHSPSGGQTGGGTQGGSTSGKTKVASQCSAGNWYTQGSGGGDTYYSCVKGQYKAQSCKAHYGNATVAVSSSNNSGPCKTPPNKCGSKCVGNGCNPVPIPHGGKLCGKVAWCDGPNYQSNKTKTKCVPIASSSRSVCSRNSGLHGIFCSDGNLLDTHLKSCDKGYTPSGHDPFANCVKKTCANGYTNLPCFKGSTLYTTNPGVQKFGL